MSIINVVITKRRVRTNASVEDKNRHIWLHRFTNLDHLGEQLGFLFVTTGGIHDNDIEPLFLEFGNTLRCSNDGICLGVRTEVRDLGFGSRLSGLVESTSTERVSTNNTGFEASFLVVDSKLRACRRFTVSLELHRCE